VSAARDIVLARVRNALAGPGGDAAAAPRDYRLSTGEPQEALVDRFAERVGEYRASVRRADRKGLRDMLGALCEEAAARRLGVPQTLPEEWRPDGIELVPDTGLAADELDRLDGALTGCALGIAETGTIVLDGGPLSGRRALTLVPDYHLCVVEEEAVVGLVPEAVERLEPVVREGRPVTFVSGPSATSDIELNRVEGVHGPRTLHVVLVA
jgi:L-lactate dehydrogenase complex protein LldG